LRVKVFVNHLGPLWQSGAARLSGCACFPLRVAAFRKLRLLRLASLTVPIGAVALASFAGETIEGAFGRKLGDVFDPSSSIRTARTADGTPEGAPIYEFSPATRFGSFEHYYVRITPTTHKIWRLEAVRDVDDRDAAQKEQAVITQHLKEHYGIEKEGITHNGMGEHRSFGQGRCCIETQVTGLIHVTFTIRYSDIDLQRKADAEKDAEKDAAAGKLDPLRDNSFTAILQRILDASTNVPSTSLTNSMGISGSDAQETLSWIQAYFRNNGITNALRDLHVGMRVEDIVAMLGEPAGRGQTQSGKTVQGKPEGQYEDWLSWYHNERGMHVAPIISVRIEDGIVKELKAGRG
jgi:hypothetical protein